MEPEYVTVYIMEAESSIVAHMLSLTYSIICSKIFSVFRSKITKYKITIYFDCRVFNYFRRKNELF